MVYVIQVCWQLANLYDIYHCCVYSGKNPDDGQRNCPKHVEFHSKNKFEKLVCLVGFIIRNVSRCTATWTSNRLLSQTLDTKFDTYLAQYNDQWSGSIVFVRNIPIAETDRCSVPNINYKLLRKGKVTGSSADSTSWFRSVHWVCFSLVRWTAVITELSSIKL